MTGPAPLRVLTLNVGSCFEPDWETRRHIIVDGLDRLEPDVVCFQEVCASPTRPNTAEWLAEHADHEWHLTYGAFPLKRRSEPGLTFGSAVLSRFPIDAATTHRLPVGPTDERRLTEMGWELLHARTAGLDVFSAHLAAAPHDQPHRVVQVQAIDELIRAARGSLDSTTDVAARDAMPPLLCGDFNAEPDSDEIRFLSSLTNLDGRATMYQDAWRVAGDGSDGFTNDWTLGELAGMLNVHRKRIDYVFVGDPFLRAGNGGRILSAERVFDTAVDGALASDHCGVLATIEWPTRPTT